MLNTIMENENTSFANISIPFLSSGFHLTFKKWFEFSNENNRKTNLKCRPTWLGYEESFSL